VEVESNLVLVYDTEPTRVRTVDLIVLNKNMRQQVSIPFISRSTFSEKINNASTRLVGCKYHSAFCKNAVKYEYMTFLDELLSVFGILDCSVRFTH